MPGNWGHTPSPGPLVSDWVPRYWGWLGRALVGLRVRSQGCQPEPPGPQVLSRARSLPHRLAGCSLCLSRQAGMSRASVIDVSLQPPQQHNQK